MKLFPSRFVLKYCILAYSIFTIFTNVLSQSLIINEVSQGPSGSKEYVEFLVVPGSGPYQCSNYCLDLRGWIIDDNNGYFSGGGGSGIGIAAGAVRFSNSSFWQCIPIGTIILVYNNQDLNVAIPSIDNSITDGNCKLVLPISSTLFENQTVSPSTTSSSYPTMGWLPGGLWGPISMANGGDSFQVYNPNNLLTPFHGVSWVNNNVNNIIYFATSSTNSVYYFANTLNNNPSNQANWVAGTCSAPDNQTPGAPNNAANASYIQGLTNNCAGPLVATLTTSVDAGSCQCNGTATVSASGSIPQYSYNWYNSSNVSINQTTPTATNLCSGSYYCVVSSSINCTDTVLVTINSNVNSLTPTFNPIAPICIGGTINLPSTSSNGITGSWSPAFNNTSTTTYTFTPDPNQCASSTSLTVQVSNTNTPTFNPIAPICIGGTINLPSTSSNGITGSWSPAVNNTSTTTYTFTPDPNQCASSTTLNVQVLNAITPTFNQLGPFCQGATAPTFSNTSLEGITGVWGPPGINTGTVGTNTYVFVSNPGQCATNQTMTITVNPYPTPIFPVQDPICFGDNLVLPSLSTNGINGSWSPAFNNTNTTTYTFTPANGQCAANTTMTVEVLSLPPIEAGNNLTICLGQSASLTGNGGISYSWSENVQNEVPFTPAVTTVYYLTGVDINGCEGIDSVTITIVPVPTASFSADPTAGLAPLTISFTNSSSNATIYNWQFGDGSTSAQENSSHDYLNSGVFTVWLFASNGICEDSISQLIQVLAPGEPEISVPNVFTPNDDGSNDEWFISTQYISELDVLIFNRWGNEVANIEGINGTWNGKTQNGVDVTDGTYFYKYQATALNGEKLTGHGFLTLIR
jgi:gliding motility-associated-like protein